MSVLLVDKSCVNAVIEADKMVGIPWVLKSCFVSWRDLSGNVVFYFYPPPKCYLVCWFLFFYGIPIKCSGHEQISSIADVLGATILGVPFVNSKTADCLNLILVVHLLL